MALAPRCCSQEGRSCFERAFIVLSGLASGMPAFTGEKPPFLERTTRLQVEFVGATCQREARACFLTATGRVKIVMLATQSSRSGWGTSAG